MTKTNCDTCCKTQGFDRPHLDQGKINAICGTCNMGHESEDRFAFGCELDKILSQVFPLTADDNELIEFCSATARDRNMLHDSKKPMSYYIARQIQVTQKHEG